MANRFPNWEAVFCCPDGVVTFQRRDIREPPSYAVRTQPPQSVAAAHNGQPAEIPALSPPVELRQVNSEANRFKHPVWMGAVPGLKGISRTDDSYCDISR